MTAVLGIDAAWTTTQPSGVALIQNESSAWQVLAVAPSYESFIQCANHKAVEWGNSKHHGGPPNMPELLAAAHKLAAEKIELIALDIPLARSKIRSRRPSDTAISQAFGAMGCSTHSPNADRPGRIADDFAKQLAIAGIELDTGGSGVTETVRAIEVYPHPALLTLLGRDFRVPYKVAKSTRYWKGTSVAGRIDRLLAEFANIYRALEAEFGDLHFKLPELGSIFQLSRLKQYEDALDALICTWVGAQHLCGRTRPYGDHDSAIWVPR